MRHTHSLASASSRVPAMVSIRGRGCESAECGWRRGVGGGQRVLVAPDERRAAFKTAVSAAVRMGHSSNNAPLFGPECVAWIDACGSAQASRSHTRPRLPARTPRSKWTWNLAPRCALARPDRSRRCRPASSVSTQHRIVSASWPSCRSARARDRSASASTGVAHCDR